MQESANHLQNVSLPPLVRHSGSKRAQKAAGQHSSPSVFPEKRGKVKSRKQNGVNASDGDPDKSKAQEHIIDIAGEQSELLGHVVFYGKLAVDKKSKRVGRDDQTVSESEKSRDAVDARLTSKALVWGSHMLLLEDVISVSYSPGVRHFTVHSYPVIKRLYILSCFLKPHRIRKDFRFIAATVEEAVQWVSGFADQQCFINCLPHPIVSNKKQTSDIVVGDPIFDLPHIKCKSPPKFLVILNPRSGHGRSSKVFHDKVEPIFKLAGFKMEVVKTTSAGHAKSLAATVDFSTCPDGIICVGGDGIVNEVLNGLLSRVNQKEAISIPIGIIPTGSDNSLVWTILGVRDPISAAMAIVKGGLTATDVFAVEGIQAGIIHYGITVTYFGFLSDVLELSGRYQGRFGPLRYFVAGFLKLLCLPKYSFELEYLPTSKELHDSDVTVLEDQDRIDMSDLYTDIMHRSRKEGIPRATSLSSIDSIMSPSRMSGDIDTIGNMLASSEPSDYVRGLDPKSKCLSSGRSNITSEPEEVLHPQHHLSANPNWPRTRSKSRIDKGWAGLIATNDSRCSWGAAALNDKEDIFSTMSDPGPIWDCEPKWDSEPRWDTEANWEAENSIQLPELLREDNRTRMNRELVPKLEEKWVVKKGHFLCVLVCNHSCKTVQSLSSQVVAPNAEHDDNSLDLLLIQGSGRMRLLRLIVLVQFGRHLSLPYVEYVKVKSVKLKPGKVSHNGCGIDGELLPVNGRVLCSLLPEQCRLIGRPVRDRM